MVRNPLSALLQVNPCNPTGDYLGVNDMKKKIEELTDHTTVLVDESRSDPRNPSGQSTIHGGRSRVYGSS